MIDLTVHRDVLARNIQKARENGVIIPTFENMRNPETVPAAVKERLRGVGLWDVNPLNLFRITWKNEPAEAGGLYRDVPNYIELPPALTGVKARIVALVGKWFPTGCHKVGASFGCLAPRLVTGQFDAGYHRAVWPSTGNYCRGGAFNSKLLGVKSVAILPAGMSRERFEWLSQIAGEVIATPGCESNVKEIFDKTHELRQEPDCMIFNQFEEMGNHLWHYQVTGRAIAEVFEAVRRPGDKLSGACFTSGSAGTIGCGDYLKEVYPGLKLAVGEALQCPTILNNGFGDHRIEGIGDKHIPWIHNVKSVQRPGGPRLPARCGGGRGHHRQPVPAGHLGHRQRAVLCQAGQVLRAHRARRGGHRPHRLGGHVRLPHPGAGRAVRLLRRHRRRGGPRPPPAGPAHRLHGGAELPGSQAGAQPEILHLGGAAGPHCGTTCTARPTSWMR